MLRKIELIEKGSGLVERGVQYFWKCWGNESNLNFYKDCIEHPLSDRNSLPKFYVLLDEDEIIGSYALLTNDLISRQDLMPWFACLFVNEAYRNQGLAEKLLTHGLDEAKRIGFNRLYLATNLNNFYERKAWDFHSKGYGVNGSEFKIYSKCKNC